MLKKYFYFHREKNEYLIYLIEKMLFNPIIYSFLLNLDKKNKFLSNNLIIYLIAKKKKSKLEFE